MLVFLAVSLPPRRLHMSLDHPFARKGGRDREGGDHCSHQVHLSLVKDDGPWSVMAFSSILYFILFFFSDSFSSFGNIKMFVLFFFVIFQLSRLVTRGCHCGGNEKIKSI